MRLPARIVPCCFLAFMLCPAHAQEKHVINVPFTLSGNMIVVPLTVNGQTVDAVVDSGASRTMIDPSVLLPKKCPSVTLSTSGGDITACKTTAEIKLIRLELPSTVYVHKLPEGIKAIVPLQDLAGDGVITFDFRTRYITITR